MRETVFPDAKSGELAGDVGGKADSSVVDSTRCTGAAEIG
jgi:hypothetical protein